jgi:hypothetical protein
MRNAVLDALGRRCCVCGTTHDLQCDLIVSDGGRHHGMDWKSRQRFYLAQWNLGNVQILCGPCNRAKASASQRAYSRLLHTIPKT